MRVRSRQSSLKYLDPNFCFALSSQPHASSRLDQAGLYCNRYTGFALLCSARVRPQQDPSFQLVVKEGNGTIAPVTITPPHSLLLLKMSYITLSDRVEQVILESKLKDPNQGSCVIASVTPPLPYNEP